MQFLGLFVFSENIIWAHLGRDPKRGSKLGPDGSRGSPIGPKIIACAPNTKIVTHRPTAAPKWVPHGPQINGTQTNGAHLFGAHCIAWGLFGTH